jgi:hypothetical protein
MPALELVYAMLSLGIMVIFLAMAAFILFTMFRAWRAPRVCYPPRPSARELVEKLMCPKCGSRELEPTGYYTIRCRACGFMFGIGGEAAYPYHPGYPSWWFWPLVGWWPLLWIWPLTWLGRE